MTSYDMLIIAGIDNEGSFTWLILASACHAYAECCLCNSKRSTWRDGVNNMSSHI